MLQGSAATPLSPSDLSIIQPATECTTSGLQVFLILAALYVTYLYNTFSLLTFAPLSGFLLKLFGICSNFKFSVLFPLFLLSRTKHRTNINSTIIEIVLKMQSESNHELSYITNSLSMLIFLGLRIVCLLDAPGLVFPFRCCQFR